MSKKVILVRSIAVDSAILKVADSLALNGFDVKLLIWDRQHTYKPTGNEKYQIFIFDIKTTHNALKTILAYPFWWLYELYFLIMNKSDVIHACDMDTLYPAIIAKFIKRNKLYYTIYDFFANLFTDNGNIIKVYIRRLIAKCEIFGISFTDVLFLVDESRIVEVKGAKIKKIVYIYNSPRDRYYKEHTHNSTSNKLTIFHAGNINWIRGIEYIVRAIENLDNINLVLAGSDDINNISMQLSDNIKNKIQYLGWINYNEVLKRTMEADVLFRFCDPRAPQCKYSSPNKLFEAMMAGIPIIINCEIGASRIVEKEDCGLCVTYGDVESLKNILICLRDDPSLRKRLGNNGRYAFKEKYSWEIMEQRLIDIYQ